MCDAEHINKEQLKVINNEKLVEDFVVYMEYESIEMKMNKHLALIHIPNWVKKLLDFEYTQYFTNPNNPNDLALLMYIRSTNNDTFKFITEYMNDGVESSIIRNKIYKNAINIKLFTLMDRVEFVEPEPESESETETEFDRSKIPLIIQACNETEIENEIKEIENEIK